MTSSMLIRGATLGPDTAQACFRAVLDALARPGTIAQLPDVDAPAPLRPVLALADLDTPVCVLGERRWADAVATVTSAPVVPASQARLAAALRPVEPAELAAFPRGSADAPERAALVALAVPDLNGGPALRLTGPGVDGAAIVAPQGFGPALRAARTGAFPAGIDLLLVAGDGAVLGLPRTTTIEEI